MKQSKAQHKRILVAMTVGLALLTSIVTALADSKSVKVAFRTVRGEPSRYITASGESLTSSSQKIGAEQIFTLTDLNGGTLDDGDSVRIQYGKMYWREDKGGVVLAGGLADNACVFIVERSSKFVLLKAHNGTWVSAPSDGGSLGTSTNKDDSTRVLDLMPQ